MKNTKILKNMILMAGLVLAPSLGFAVNSALTTKYFPPEGETRFLCQYDIDNPYGGQVLEPKEINVYSFGVMAPSASKHTFVYYLFSASDEPTECGPPGDNKIIAQFTVSLDDPTYKTADLTDVNISDPQGLTSISPSTPTDGAATIIITYQQ